jgi:hypothetical protein
MLAGALAISMQLWLSGTTSLGVVMPVMLCIHTLIGVRETLVTVAALTFALRTWPELI